MAMRVTLEKPIIGVDVAKNELVIYHDQYDRLEAIPNTKVAITQWLKALASSCAIAIEATNVYHVLFADALGLDLRVSKSGQSDGPRRLTKRGDPEARRLLHNAAMSGSRTPAWKPFYEEQRKRGFSTTQALVMLSRKLARVVFALLKNQSEYQTKVA
ncbi:Transposase [Pseudomonas syringae pv. syringae HS191]|uniref:IS110 family transposase n=1 Tax=Pseudomonas syringae TaxID=317 RepID=UPI0006243C3F|nr:IS110 family transposase [Pseudomonas syringae]AKF50241.1 Transposase [Pseudomonas syringae pv. syringae HS191]